MSAAPATGLKVLLTLQDVEPAVRLNAWLERAGIQTSVVSPIDDMRGTIRREKPDAVVFTGGVTDAGTAALVRELLWDGTAAVALVERSDPVPVEVLREIGYVEVYRKPVDVDETAQGIRRLVERRQLQRQTGLIGESDALREVLVKVEQIAPVTSTVLIEGESGTGKELVARAIRMLSPRRNKPFIAVNVGALPETLLESELFGHEKGAFTGAAERRLGRFELANDGTLFLDEIGEIPLTTQVKLLRALEEREIMRVGGTQPIRVDVRVIAATNRPLRQHVEEGSFRSDLYYRLNVLSIYLPPLRERADDIPLLVRRFIDEFSTRHDRPFSGISAEAMELMVSYPWPGNVRELRNLVESMVVLSHGQQIVPEDLPRQIREGGSARWLPVHVGAVARGAEEGAGRELEFILRSILELKLQVEDLRRRVEEGRVGGNVGGREQWIGDFHPASLGEGGEATGQGGGSRSHTLAGGALEPRGTPPPPNVVTVQPGTPMAEVERAVIEATLRETRGNRRRAAELLGIGERTLYRKIRDYQLVEGGVEDGAEAEGSSGG
jgi:DNA-binding NtrC family response regulator